MSNTELTELQKTTLCVELLDDDEGVPYGGYRQLKLLGLVPDEVEKLVKFANGRAYINHHDLF